MDTTSVAYVLCRIEDDASLTPISEHEDIIGGVAAGRHQVELEDFTFSYGLYADGVKDHGHQCSEEHNCFKCLEGWEFLGSLDHDEQEILDAIRCRRCRCVRRDH